MLQTRDSLQGERHKQIESEGKEKDISCKWKQQESMSSNTHTRHNRLLKKALNKDKEGHYIMIKGSIQEKDSTLVNIYELNIGAPTYVKQILTDIKREIGNNTIIKGEFYMLLT